MRVKSEKFQDILNELEEQPAWRRRADREADYEAGNQLDSDLLARQKEIGIPSAVENMIGPLLEDIRASEVKNRTDWQVTPEHAGEGADVAKAIDIKLNEAEKRSGADLAITEAFAHQIGPGMGWVEVDRNPNPYEYKYRVRFVHRNEVWWDMNATMWDLSDAAWLMRRKWTYIDIAKALFPGKERLIESVGVGWDDLITYEGGDDTQLYAGQDIERGWTIEEQKWRDTDNRRICIHQLLTREWKKKLVLNIKDRIVEFDKDNPYHLQAAMHFPLQEAMCSEVWKTFFLGPHRLHLEKLDFGGAFNIVPFWGNKEDRTGVPYGVTRNLMYLQDELNARISKMQWILASRRSTSTSGLINMKPEIFRQTMARPDAHIELDHDKFVAGGRLEVSTDLDVNAQQFQRMNDIRESMRRIARVSMAYQGQGGSDSASGLQLQVDQTEQSLSTIQDNHNRARKSVANLLMGMIIEDSTEEEHISVSGGMLSDDRVIIINQRVEGQDYRNNDVQRTKLKISLSEVPSTPSYRQGQLASIAEVYKAAPEPYKMGMFPSIVDLMNVQDKPELVKVIRDVAKQPTPEEIDERIKEAVEKTKVELQYDLKAQELELKKRDIERKEALDEANIRKIIEETVKVGTETVATRLETIYSSTQAGAEIAMNPQVAPVSDQLLKSAGAVDQDEPPIVAMPEQGLLPEIEEPVQNTSPLFPPRVQQPEVEPDQLAELNPESPVEGIKEGLERRGV
jgi:hypothetical protein